MMKIIKERMRLISLQDIKVLYFILIGILNDLKYKNSLGSFFR